MANLEEITEVPRGDRVEEPARSVGEDPSTRAGKDAERERKNASDVGDPGAGSPSDHGQGNLKVDGGGDQIGQPAVGSSQKNDLPQTMEDVRGEFYKHYRKEAEEYDREFLKKHDEDLNTTLIFAGLFSAVTSAFIIEVNSQLQPDPNEETAALLRVLIYKVDNTTFGNNIPTIPQWTGPPHAVVQVLAILFASLAASLFSAFLAMLGKQWLNRYVSVDMRGSAIERSQNRQRKLDGIVSWYFDHVMDSLPAMLQVALLLLGCALYRYFWDINRTVASVVLGATSFGALCYLFIVFAGTAFVSCPYQTPTANILRNTPHILGMLYSVFFPYVESSTCYYAFAVIRDMCKAHDFAVAITVFLMLIPVSPLLLLSDVFVLTAYTIAGFFGLVASYLERLERQTVVLDLHCILWMLQTSLDGPIRLSALKYLETMVTSDFDPALAVGCFDVLIGCVQTSNGSAVTTQGSEQLATVSALCCLHALSHLTTIDPKLRVLEGIRQRYARVLKSETNLDGLPFSHTLGVIHKVFYPTRTGIMEFPSKSDQITLYTWSARRAQRILWEDYRPSSNEHVGVARALAKLARFENWRRGGKKVPRWLLGFALHFLSQDPLPPTSVIVSCLSIIAIDLGCDVPRTTTPDNSERMEQVSNLITEKLETMVQAADKDPIHSKHKAINTLLVYAIHLGRSGERGMVDVSLRAAMASDPEEFIWPRIEPYITRLSNSQNPPSLDLVITLASPHVPWKDGPYDGDMVARWAAAALAVPHSEAVGQNVVGALLHIASVDTLRPHIPVGVWTWLKMYPSLPPEFSGRSRASSGDVVRQVRELGDVETLKSYLLLVWSEWDPIDSEQSGGLAEMQTSIREDFGGIGMWCHREDLVKRLDHVLGQLDGGLEHLRMHRLDLDERYIPLAKEQYGGFEEVLLELDGEAMGILTQSHSTFMCALPLQCL